MIHYSILFRLADGTPLSETADDGSCSNLPHAKETITSLIAPQLVNHPVRICVQDDLYTIHCIHMTAVGFVAVCEPNYSHLLAFSFLDELLKEFTILYTASVVAAVRRPYAFTEFDSFLQKVRQKYNSSHYIASHNNLPELRNELSLEPPTILSASQLAPPNPAQHTSAYRSAHTTYPHTSLPIQNGVANGSATDNSQVGVSARMMPLSLGSRMFIFLAGLLMLLDIYRGMTSLSQSNLEEYDGPSPIHGFGFIAEAVILGSQVAVLRRYHRFRKLWSVCSMAAVTLLSSVLLTAVRDTWLSLAYVTISLCLTYATLNRNFQTNLNKFNV